jgi:hypothetical protein
MSVSNRKSQFKYTKEPDRQNWVNNTREIIDKFIPLLTKEIDYSFNQPQYVDITFYKHPINDNPNNDEGEFYNTETYLMKPSKPFKYKLLGGIVYRLLEMKYPDSNLNYFVDDTGDIDMSIVYPSFEENEEINKKIIDDNNTLSFNINKFNKEGKLNCFYENNSKQLFDQIHNKIIEYNNNNTNNNIFDNLVEINFSDYYECKETEILDNKDIGLAKLVRFVNGSKSMIKIQLILKYADTSIDHIFEIIFILADFTSIDFFKQIMNEPIEVKIPSLNNKINIQPINGLIVDNIDAYIVRKELMASDKRHKPLNHIGRLLYLFNLFKIGLLQETNDDFINLHNRQILIQYTTINFNHYKYYLENNEFKLINETEKKNGIIKKTQRREININFKDINLIFYKIGNDNYTFKEIKINVINILKAFIDVFYEMDKDGFLTKIKSTMDLPFWNMKNIKDIFDKNENKMSFKELYHNNQNYVMIMSSINKTFARRHIRTVVSHVKINKSVIPIRRRKLTKILYAHSFTKSNKSNKSNTRKLKTI